MSGRCNGAHFYVHAGPRAPTYHHCDCGANLRAEPCRRCYSTSHRWIVVAGEAACSECVGRVSR